MSYDYTKLTTTPIQAPLTTTHTNVLSKEERPLQELTANKDRVSKVLTQGGFEMPLRNDKVNKLIEDKVAHILRDRDGKTTTITEDEVDKIKEDICCNFQPHEIQSYLNKYRRVK